jgi:hypothetical protein
MAQGGAMTANPARQEAGMMPARIFFGSSNILSIEFGIRHMPTTLVAFFTTRINMLLQHNLPVVATLL